MVNLKSILIQYANERGGGLPLTPQEVCNAVVLWCQNFVREKYPDISVSDPLEVSKVEFDDKTIFNISLPYGNISNVVKTVVDAFYLNERIEGSETIIVDINESGDGIEIHLDSEVVSKIERAILLPLQAPQVPSIPVVGVNNAVEYAPVSGLGGGTKLYLHTLNIGGPRLFIVSTYPNAYNIQDITDYAQCSGLVYTHPPLSVVLETFGANCTLITNSTSSVIDIYTISNTSGALSSRFNFSKTTNITDSVIEL